MHLSLNEDSVGTLSYLTISFLFLTFLFAGLDMTMKSAIGEIDDRTDCHPND